MISDRSRLLLLLVLLSAVATTGWTTARADGRAASPAVSLAAMSKPPAVPTSGEPDVGQTPRRPVVTPGSMLPAPRGEDVHRWGPVADPGFGWIFRLWAIRYLGAR
jgi:hypothetical protein